MQPQDSKSRQPGDSEPAVLARRRWLDAGHMDGLVDTLHTWLTSRQDLPADDVVRRVMDLGCGEGFFGRALFQDPAYSYCGIDLSKRAVKLSARRWPEATWVMANADRFLPAVDGSVHIIASFFGRRPLSEVNRVLADGGEVIVAVPGEEDLIELRSEVQQSGHRRRRWEAIVDQFASVGLMCDRRETWQQQVHLDQDAIQDAMAMSYRGVRHSQQRRLESLSAMDVTVAADLMRFRRG